MIADTSGVDCDIIRQSELGVYDTVRVPVVYSCNGFIRLKTGEEFRLHNNEKLIERIKK
jgi:hypothetical protein